MEENKDEEVVTQDNANKDEGKAFKVFKTEEDYQNAVNKIIRDKVPSKEKLDAFKKWEENQKTQEQKYADLTLELEKSNNSRKNYENLIEVIDSGVKKEFRDFVADKVGKEEGDFGKNLKTFLKDNPQFIEGNTQIKTVNTSPKLNGNINGINSTNQFMNDAIRSLRN